MDSRKHPSRQAERLSGGAIAPGLHLFDPPLGQQPRDVLTHAAPLHGLGEDDARVRPIDERVLADVVQAARLGEELEERGLALADACGEAVEPLSDDSIVLWGPGEPRRFDLVGDELVEAEFEFVEFEGFGFPPAGARDTSGTHAWLDSNEIVLTADPSGEDEVGRIPWPMPTGCCTPEVGLTFLTIDSPAD